MFFNGLLVTVEYPNRERKIVCINKVSEHGEFLETPLTYEDFVSSVLSLKNIDKEDFVCFLNAVDAEIERDIFRNYMCQYSGHPNFILKLKTKASDDENLTVNVKRQNAAIGASLIVTSESLKQFLQKLKYGSVLLNNFDEKQKLTDNERRMVVRYIATYLEQTFGFTPSRDEQLAVARACISIFPCFSLDILYNSEHNGFLQVKLKNDRKRKRDLEKENKNCEEKSSGSSGKQTESISDPNVLRDLNFIKNAILPEEVDLLKEKLKNTVEVRKKQRQNQAAKECKYYFLCPDLINFDFEVTFGKGNFANHWEKYQQHIFHVVRTSGKNILYTEAVREKDWNTETLSVLNLLRLLPPQPTGKKKLCRLTDEKAVDRLLLFKKKGLTNEEYLEASQEKPPYLIAVGDCKSNIHQYNIVFDSQIIPLNPNFDILEGIDLVFKLHFLWNIEYDTNLRIFWNFIQHSIYKLPTPKLSTLARDLDFKFFQIFKEHNVET